LADSPTLRDQTPRAHPKGGVVQKSAFARFYGSFDFRLFQQYLPLAEAKLMAEFASIRGRFPSLVSGWKTGPA
jgi:hypothetical protein